MNELDWAYLGGLFDGEGCVCISKVTDKHGYCMLATVANTDKEIIDWLYNEFGGTVGTKNTPGAKDFGNRRPCYQWSIRTRMAQQFLRNLLPYLRIKKERAEIAIAFQDLFQMWHGKAPVEEDNLTQRDEYWYMLKELNKVGIK